MPGNDSEEGMLTMFPLFLTADVPVETINSLISSLRTADAPVSCVLLTEENTSTSALESLKSKPEPTEPTLSSAPSTPFTSQAPEDLYAYWKQHVRPPLDKPLPLWSAFTFLVLDSKSASSEEPTVLVCSDAPDRSNAPAAPSAAPSSATEEEEKGGEATPRLKVLRLSFADATLNLPALEMLSLCPSEVHAERALKVVPLVYMTDVEERTNEDGSTTFEGRFDSPANAWRKKADALKRAAEGNVELDSQVTTRSVEVSGK